MGNETRSKAVINWSSVNREKAWMATYSAENSDMERIIKIKLTETEHFSLTFMILISCER
jgi:hypothetical protein